VVVSLVGGIFMLGVLNSSDGPWPVRLAVVGIAAPLLLIGAALLFVEDRWLIAQNQVTRVSRPQVGGITWSREYGSATRIQIDHGLYKGGRTSSDSVRLVCGDGRGTVLAMVDNSGEACYKVLQLGSSSIGFNTWVTGPGSPRPPRRLGEVSGGGVDRSLDYWELEIAPEIVILARKLAELTSLPILVEPQTAAGHIISIGSD
jgi:hypothetical protein